MITLRAILLLLTLVAPGAEHTGSAYPFALAVLQVVRLDPPPPGWTQEMGAAALLVTLYEEGRFCAACKRGDNGRSVCSGQVWASTAARARELETSIVACTRAAYYAMRAGARICPDAPLAPYAGSCNGKETRKIATRREEKARRMVEALHARMAVP